MIEQSKSFDYFCLLMSSFINYHEKKTYMDSKFISTMVISSLLAFALFGSLTAEVANVYAQQITLVSSSNEDNPNQEEKDDNTKQEDNNDEDKDNNSKQHDIDDSNDDETEDNTKPPSDNDSDPSLWFERER